jgi:proline iminopeptidase
MAGTNGRRRNVIVGIGIALVVVVAAGLLAFRWLTGRAMFTPGQAAARIAAAGESLDPAGPDGAGPWKVAPGVELFHFAAGAGEDVLVIHGGPGIAPERPWRAAARLDGLRLHFYHQRGCGRSTHPITAPPEGSTWQRIAAAEARLGLAEQVADVERVRRILGKERLVVIGHSFGALVASLWAAEFPARVKALVLVAPAPLFELPGGKESDLFALVRARLPAALHAEYDAYLEESFDFSAALALDDAALSARWARFGRFYVAAGGMAPPPAGAEAGPPPMPGGWMQLGVFLSMGRRHDWRAAMRAAAAPVLVVHGERDLQPRAQSERVSRLFPAGRLAVVPGAGHFVFDEAPDAFAEVVRRFLADVGAIAPALTAASGG